MFDLALIQELEKNPVQDPFRVKARLLGIEAARAVREGRPLPRTGELIFDDHLEAVERWVRSPEIERRLKRLGPPFAHRGVEGLIRATAGELDAQMAALIAWCTPLRQTVGSCFATAPCQLVQRVYPDRFLDDMEALLSKGQLIRVVEGQEVRVPLALNWGEGELHRPCYGVSPGLKRAFAAAGVAPPAQWKQGMTPDEGICEVLRAKFRVTSEQVMQRPLVPPSDVIIQPKRATDLWKEAYERARAAFLSFADCPLLRAWEYTVASMCDVKAGFSSWNLYVGLGLDPRESGGLTQALMEVVQKRLEFWNDRLRILKGAEQERASQVADGLSKCVPLLVETWIARFPEAFQEVYDPSLVDRATFEDQPAGFRLMYKGGRGSAATWQPIQTSDEFSDALRQFFSVTERDIAAQFDFVGAREELGQIITHLIQKLQAREFMEGAVRRAQRHHGARATPWLYISGGTIETLLQSYFELPLPLRREARQITDVVALKEWVESRGGGAQLMVSPTHAFVLRPDWLPRGVWADTNWSNWVFAFMRDVQGRMHLVRTDGRQIVETDAWATGEWAIFLA